MSIRRLIDPSLSLPNKALWLLGLALASSVGITAWACYALFTRQSGFFFGAAWLLVVGIIGQHLVDTYPQLQKPLARRLHKPSGESFLVLCFVSVWLLFMWGIVQTKMDPDHITGWQILIVFIVLPVPLTLAFARSMSKESGHLAR